MSAGQLCGGRGWRERNVFVPRTQPEDRRYRLVTPLVNREKRSSASPVSSHWLVRLSGSPTPQTVFS
ncbi:hypothetical protein CHARACLAT_009663 [Characodon lateralis]|uniref:Uncharacterized protein n=1 Tax=Characodon lateralis TaxID=208331 RepID=A0ABU7ESB0_9TELE|nr:hypothetical protein [Characodon lateralis]